MPTQTQGWGQAGDGGGEMHTLPAGLLAELMWTHLTNPGTVRQCGWGLSPLGLQAGGNVDKGEALLKGEDLTQASYNLDMCLEQGKLL